MKIRHKAVPAVYLILERDGLTLVALRINTGYQDNTYNVTSGHVEAGELPKMAMVREAREEIGIEIAPKDLEFVHVLYRTAIDEAGDYMDIFFRAHAWKGEPENMEPHKCGELKWVSLAELPGNMTPHIRHALKCIEQGIKFSEL